MKQLATLILAFVGMVLAGVALPRMKDSGFWFFLLALLFLGAAILIVLGA